MNRMSDKYTKGVFARGDAEIHYEICGAGPALIFAHGLGGNRLSWWQQIAHFSRRYTCIAFSHRGFAPSRMRRARPDPADFADDLEALISHLGLEDVRLVAQSMGGWTCLEYALRVPKRVTALVLASTTGTVDPGKLPESDPAALELWSKQAALQMERLRAADIHPAAGERMAHEQPALHHLYRQIDSLNTGLDKEALRQQLYAARVTGPERLAALNMPVLCISGAEDVVIPTAAVHALSFALPSASFEAHPESGHSVYFERATWFNERLDRFLRI